MLVKLTDSKSNSPSVCFSFGTIRLKRHIFKHACRTYRTAQMRDWQTMHQSWLQLHYFACFAIGQNAKRLGNRIIMNRFSQCKQMDRRNTFIRGVFQYLHRKSSVPKASLCVKIPNSNLQRIISNVFLSGMELSEKSQNCAFYTFKTEAFVMFNKEKSKGSHVYAKNF